MAMHPLQATKSILWYKANTFFFNAKPTKGSDLCDPDLFVASVSNVEVPDIANENFEEYYAGMWYTAPGRNSIYQLTATFKNPEGIDLYDKFSQYLVMTRKDYFDDIKWTLQVDSENPGRSRHSILWVDNALLVGVSNITFDHSVDQILEFSVTWKFALFNEEAAIVTGGL
jgi:hypothetical protein